jgi:hypothetical protein
VCFSCLRLLQELLIKLNDAALQSREDSISHCIVLRAGVFLYWQQETRVGVLWMAFLRSCACAGLLRGTRWSTDWGNLHLLHISSKQQFSTLASQLEPNSHLTCSIQAWTSVLLKKILPTNLESAVILEVGTFWLNTTPSHTVELAADLRVNF